MPRFRLTALALALLTAPLHADEEKLHVDADFPGGNIILDKMDGATVHLHHDLRDTAGDWFYWSFRVRGGQGRTLTFQFKSNVIGVHGPAVSDDAGKTWRWLGAQAVRSNSFHYSFPADAKDVRFCMAFPYQEHHQRAFLKLVPSWLYQMSNWPAEPPSSLCPTSLPTGGRIWRMEGPVGSYSSTVPPEVMSAVARLVVPGTENSSPPLPRASSERRSTRLLPGDQRKMCGSSSSRSLTKNTCEPSGFQVASRSRAPST